MIRRFRVIVAALLAASAPFAAEAASCRVRKGLYDAWLSLGKHGAKVDAAAAQGIQDEYRSFFQCLNDAPAPADEENSRSFCKDAGTDRLAAVVCQTALYLKTGRSQAKDFLDALPANKKSAETIWDLQAILDSGGRQKEPYPALFRPAGPVYTLVDELFVLVLDDRDTALGRYFSIAANAPGPAAGHTDTQIKILLREAPAVVVRQWASLRQYQPILKRLLSQLATELTPADMKKLRQGVAGFCAKDNLDCPEIQKVFGKVE